MKKVTDEANAFMKKQDSKGFKEMSVADVALGFIDVANEAMCRPIRALTQVSFEFYENFYYCNSFTLFLC